MEDLIGVYGILDLDHWPNAPFLLLDGGVEKDGRNRMHFIIQTAEHIPDG